MPDLDDDDVYEDCADTSRSSLAFLLSFCFLSRRPASAQVLLFPTFHGLFAHPDLFRSLMPFPSYHHLWTDLSIY